MGGVVKTQVVKYIRKGEKGEKGDNAINIVLSPQTVILKKGVSERKIIGVELFDGTEKIPYNNDGNSPGFQCSVLDYYAELPEGLDWSFTCDLETKAFSYILRHNSSAENINAELKFYAEYNGIKYESKIIVKTVADGEKGATLRGPQAWSDCAVGYNFKAGKSGEEWKDVVLYNGNYYSCVKSHAKTDSNYPGSTTDTNSGYWQLGDKVELVATKILLATYALVENLGVTAIDMKDSSGNVLFQAKDGNVICNTGVFTNCIVDGYLQTKFTSVGSDSFTVSDVLNIATPGGFYNQVITLPSDASFIGKRVTIVNTNYPPYTRTSIGYFTAVCVDATAQSQSIGIGGNIDVDASGSDTPANIKEIRIRGGVVELLAVPKGWDDSSYCRWIVISGKHSIMSYTTM